MSSIESTSVLAVNRGLEHPPAGVATPVSIDRLEAFVGNWLTEGHTVHDGGRGARIVASDTYVWGPGRCCVIHYAHGIIGDAKVASVEIIGPGDDEDSFVSYLHDGGGNVTTSSLSHRDGDWVWQGTATRCTGEVDDEGNMYAYHERREADGPWVPSIEVLIRRVAYGAPVRW